MKQILIIIAILFVLIHCVEKPNIEPPDNTTYNNAITVNLTCEDGADAKIDPPYNETAKRIEGTNRWEIVLWENANISAYCEKESNKSDHVTRNYHISLPIPQEPVITPDSGKYAIGLKIYMKTQEEENTTLSIHYTLDGTNVTSNSLIYGGPIVLESPKKYTVRAKTFKTFEHNNETRITESAQIEKEYDVQDKCAGVNISKDSGYYSEPFNVSVTASVDGNTIYCALGDANSTKYTAPILISAPIGEKINLTCYEEGETCLKSDTILRTYTFTNATQAPIVVPPASEIYYKSVMVNITCPEENSTPKVINLETQKPLNVTHLRDQIWYLNLTESIHISVQCTHQEKPPSSTKEFNYTVLARKPPPQKPTFEPEPKLYKQSVIVRITQPKEGCEVWYIINNKQETGKNVKDRGSKYTLPLTIHQPGENLLQAITYCPADGDDGISDIMSGKYEILGVLDKPTFSPDPSKIYDKPINVTIEVKQSDTKVVYKSEYLNGEYTSSTKKPLVLEITKNITLNLQLSKLHYEPLNTSVTYTIIPPTEEPNEESLAYLAPLVIGLMLFCGCPIAVIIYLAYILARENKNASKVKFQRLGASNAPIHLDEELAEFDTSSGSDLENTL